MTAFGAGFLLFTMFFLLTWRTVWSPLLSPLLSPIISPIVRPMVNSIVKRLTSGMAFITPSSDTVAITVAFVFVSTILIGAALLFSALVVPYAGLPLGMLFLVIYCSQEASKKKEP